ncbi:MAG: MarR family transcriptional regulator [Rhodanobacter sp.]
MKELSERLINLFGALAIGVADRVRWEALDETALGGEGSAALVVIGHAPGMSIDQLSRVLGLSHPGAVRLVDRLTNAGLAVRELSLDDRRAVALGLTAEGRSQRAALLKRRNKALKAVLAVVRAEDMAVLERIADAMLQTLPDDAASALTVCRYCNERQCPDCPMDVFGELT